MNPINVELPMMPITVRIREACRITGIGRSKLYELIASGEIETIKVGAITLLPVAGLQRFIETKRTVNREQELDL